MKNISKMKIFNLISFDKGRNRWLLTIALMVLATTANAQTQDNTAVLFTVAVGLILIVALLVIIVAIYTLQVLKAMIKERQGELAETAEEVIIAEPTLWEKFLKLANRRVDIDEEESIILDHDYDGIHELDNHLPPWWTYLFYATVVFAVVYVFVYHVTDTFPLQAEEYAIEVAEASAAAEVRMAANVEAGGFDESTLEYSDDPAILASGETIYTRQCAVCHKADGGGSIGPNLTDKYWIHGATIQEIYTTIKVGVPDKGMISWESMLSPEQMRDVSSYIISIGGTNPAGAKAAQGELVE